MEAICVNCRKPNSDSKCGVCGGEVCRKCRRFLSEEAFPFMSDRPTELRHSIFCGQCYAQNVEPFEADYEAFLVKAKQIIVIFKNSKSTIRVLRKANKAISVVNRVDRNEAISNLAFVSARAGFNAIIEVEASSKKVRNEGYQTTTWSAQGLPADIRSHEQRFD